MAAESPTALRDRVLRVRELLRTAKDFIVPWDYFHDELAPKADFMSAGESGVSPLIDAAIERIADSRGWSRPQGQQPTTHIPEFEFWHGPRFLGARNGIFFYDERTCQGLLGVMTNFTGPVDLFRFTTIALPADS
ncbi:hypothetical protein [Nocardia macrotermitis]|uniref:Uncharacterized protein n=1 Tax=Nocardia macrotermitis TaxID=2585198 RepID=A0A7K0CYG3_9NOCA|nr:hypothetical protein [Nocardia macrotermitis]MQY18525.1 hypothetical protein [Nocardia macrotermitis]